MTTDFRDGFSFPRHGRLPAGRHFWLLRVFDKARAWMSGQLGERWGVTRAEFEAAILEHPDGQAILRRAQRTIPDSAAGTAFAPEAV